MHVLTHIGEAAVTVGEREFVFRPTLAAISRIGSPAEIVEAYACLMSQPELTQHTWRNRQVVTAHWRQQLHWALVTLICCCDDPDVDWLIGSAHPPHKYRAGKMPVEAVMILARQMLRHGVVGEVKRDQPTAREGEYSPEFNASTFAALAQAHLGVTSEQAWSMTMTGLLQTLHAKYPPPKEKGGPPVTVDRNDRAMAHLRKINAARKAANNG